MFDVLQPGKIVFGKGCFETVGVQAGALSGERRRTLLVTGRRAMRRAGTLARAERLLSAAGLEVVLFDRVEHDPSLETVERGTQAARSEGCDAVVAVGGGSALDAGKAIAFMATQDESLDDCFHGRAEPAARSLPVVAVPTTAGTGAEVTRNAVLTDRAAGVKKSLRHEAIVPEVALCERMLTASTMAAMAFGNASLGAVHGLAHPLGMELGLAHGLICGVLLPEVLEINLEADFRDRAHRSTGEKLSGLAAHLGYGSSGAMVDGLREIRSKVGLPEDFRDHDLSEERIGTIVPRCRSGSMRNNPRRLSDDELAAFLRRMAGR